ncbi:MAG: flagellar biosynthesis protein FliQ [Alphaproteobacteria bacterium]|nr:flagellar biosynthesis protein FliQ [Alphaproteobacteria bacterium]OJV15823.1 MAG: flagellar biosynthetic protein FliQ [Alphaproteobacteria bacterium 33-17]
MEQQEVLTIAHDAIIVLMKVGAPILLVALSVGLIISLFQALTQIQENTLSFVPKMIAILVCLMIAMPWMGSQLRTFNERVMEKIIGIP